MIFLAFTFLNGVIAGYICRRAPDTLFWIMVIGMHIILVVNLTNAQNEVLEAAAAGGIEGKLTMLNLLMVLLLQTTIQLGGVLFGLTRGIAKLSK